MKIAAIVLAAGSGTRFGGHKQFERIGGRRLVDLAVDAVSGVADELVVVVPPDVTWGGHGRGAAGGETRARSVRNGLAIVSAAAEIVVVHDAAHPFASRALVARVVDAAGRADGAVPVLATRETVAHVDEHGVLLGAVPRAGLVLVQMPHAFRIEALRAAHADDRVAIDDASMLQDLGHRIVTVPGEAANVHVTTVEELELLRRMPAVPPELP
jgi:2-C-methyl-D-erythritol 4-phosphate cytidylyltransferase